MAYEEHFRLKMYHMHPIRWIWLSLGVLFLTFGGIWLLSRVWYYPMFGYRMPMMGRLWPFGLFGVVFFFLLIALIVRLANWRSWRGYQRNYWSDSHAEEILRERYARGEITKEQFDQMMRDLRDR